MSKLIVITHPQFLPDESLLIRCAIDAGADYMHLRKPQASCGELEKLLQQIPVEYHNCIVLHDWHELSQHYAVGGIHINARNNKVSTQRPDVRLSRSCHTLEEVAQHKTLYEYLFLSPIYDSISKVGYKAAFTHEQLMQASTSGIIDHRVIALGGISAANIERTMQYRFGGVAIMGCLWNDANTQHIEHTIKQIKRELLCCNL